MDRRRGGRSQSRFDHRPEREEALVSASEAAALLGVKRTTLYTYVSRGWVRCVPVRGTKENRYARADLERLKARHDARAGHAAVAAGALRWGEPVIDSAVSRVEARGLAYRGRQPAVALATEGRSFEDVAELLWSGVLPEPRGTAWRAPRMPFAPSALAALLPRGTPPAEVLSTLVSLLGARDALRVAAPREQELARARGLLRHLAAWVCVARAPGRVTRALQEKTVADSLARAWAARSPRAPALLNQALVLCADHELNVSTFAARVTASSGADLYACIGAAMAALSGPKHGGACDRVEALLAEVQRPARAKEVVAEYLRQGGSVPGFGHRLYPGGDPRTPPLIQAAREVRPEAPGVRVAHAVVEVMREAGHPAPSMEVGLVMLAEALGLPKGAASTVFAVGRSAGWVAHVLEQREQGHLLRPRARYVGPPASDAATAD
ncbi:citrate synthase family protein [Corallococcus silvisoli]|uniref:citrate synthase family protein n=1 Tax=Corallococcus silvisoli TaxID=2697031 RepID=UPI0013786E43|nr:citrate synthase family protein [Corallococcus silvisoli]NBD08903.1 helix-turn-helix domain-containing protein [Corallococcus silvisoli]